MTWFRSSVLMLMISALGAPTAFAQNITGVWSFKTDIQRKGCTITGNMSISPPTESGARTCSFVSREVCGSAPDIEVVMDQACKITPQGKSFIMRSTVIASQTDGYNIANYLADHFVVKPSSPKEMPKEMKGIWQDARYSASVIFWREDALPVS